MAVEEPVSAPEPVPAEPAAEMPKGSAAEDAPAMDVADMARSDLQSREAAEGAEEPELEAEPSLVPTLPMIEPALLNVVVERYEGELDKYGQYTGTGILFFQGGHVYTGDLQFGRLHGVGSYEWCDGIKYEGQFVNNMIEGEGTWTWPAGGTYTGQVTGGKRHGHGKLSFADSGAFYEGEWVNGVRQGKGILEYSPGVFYDGEWQDDMMQGHGTFTYANGNTYKGEWKGDKKSGRGVMHWRTTNEMYDGDWKNGEMHGSGEHVWLQAIEGVQFLMKNSYEGEFKHGKRDGKGTFTYATGACYIGDWANNIKEGTGTFTYEDGTVFNGKFANDKPVDDPRQGGAGSGGTQVRINIEDLLADEEDAEETQRAVAHLILRYNSELRMIYRHYAWLATGGVDPSAGKSFTISMPQFWRFLKDCRIPSPELPMSQLDVIAIKVNVHGESLSAGRVQKLTYDDVDLTGISPGSKYVDPHNPDNALLFREFIEAIVRIGHHKYHSLPQLERRVHKVLNQNIIPHAGKVTPDPFVKRMDDHEVRLVLAEHKRGLESLFAYAAELIPDNDPESGDTVNQREFIRVLQQTECIGSGLSVMEAQRSFKEANFCEEMTWRDADGGFDEEEEEEDIFGLETEMILSEFIEGVARCADKAISGDYPLEKKLGQFVKKMMKCAQEGEIQLKIK
mmetsp:Transcript_71714/g.226586  ORF Transcript_71714/g.226586 Transcript_71714/m.226586 type:complete len:678 (-) Transcript_71714:106-2139(-)